MSRGLYCALPCALALLLVAGGAQAAEAAKGSLVIIGGGLRADNAEVWRKIVALAGGKGARIAVFPTAALEPEREGRMTAEFLNRYGARAFVVPLAPRLAGTSARKTADDPALAATIRKAGGAFFTGGDQARITATLRHADGSNTAVLDALWAVYRRGGVIAGTSAGAAIMSGTMFSDPPLDVLPVLQNGVVDGKDVAPGLGFVGDDVFVDQHFLIRGRIGRMLPAMLAKGYTLGLGIDENTAVVVGPGRDAAVIGYRGALVVDLSQAGTDKNRSGFNLSNARISYLDSGDRFNLASREVVPGPDKAPLRTEDRELRGPIVATDILGNTAVVDLMEKLVDSDQQRAVGLAFDASATTAGGTAPERGFEFTFTRVPDTRAYATNREDAYSIYRIRMDVRPVRLHQPLYTPE
jgi:cyanophycinase